MSEFLASGHGMALVLILGVILGVVFAFIQIVEAKIEDEFDPICEEKCKKCVCYDICRKHGTDYECKDYFPCLDYEPREQKTEDMLNRKGVDE